MIQRILVAVDASPRAPEVADLADMLGKQFQAEVMVLRIVDLPPELPPAAATPPDTLASILEERAREDLARLIEVRPQLQALPPILSATEPWKHIVETASQQRVDLIVIGSHGYHGWDRLLGTTAAKVVDHAACHVFVVHPRTPAEATS